MKNLESANDLSCNPLYPKVTGSFLSKVAAINSSPYHVVISARDLLPKDRRTGSSDPFCQITLGDETYKTEIMSRDLNPQWNEEFYLYVIFSSDSNNLFSAKWRMSHKN